MIELYNILSKYSLDDVIDIEKSDRQYIALSKLYKNIENKNLYLALIVANSLVCYQLSGKGEDYWEEFSEYFSVNNVSENNFIGKLGTFISNSKNNKRFVQTKINRLSKISSIFTDFDGEYFFDNMLELRNVLAKTMNQKVDAKTIVFAVKMFSYGARNIYGFKEFPREIVIPIDSRLIKLYEKYKGVYEEIDKFYFDLSNKMGIAELHLDALLWVNYDNLIK